MSVLGDNCSHEDKSEVTSGVVTERRLAVRPLEGETVVDEGALVDVALESEHGLEELRVRGERHSGALSHAQRR